MGNNDAEPLEPAVRLAARSERREARRSHSSDHHHVLLDRDPRGQGHRWLPDAVALELGPRCARRLRERAYLLDPQRLETRALSRMAKLGPPTVSGVLPVSWMSNCIDDAVRDLIVEDAEEEALGLVHPRPLQSPHAFMVHWFALEGGRARTAAVRFNGLPDSVRETFHALTVEGLTVAECLRRGRGPEERLKREVRLALKALFLVEDERMDGGSAEDSP